jgi:hypothetical protein
VARSMTRRGATSWPSSSTHKTRGTNYSLGCASGIIRRRA